MMEKCSNCDQICTTRPDLNPDMECWGRMTAVERQAYLQMLIDTNTAGTITVGGPKTVL